MKLRFSSILTLILLASLEASANDAPIEPLAVGAPDILGAQGNRDASTFGRDVSADGQRVVFVTRSDNLDPTDRDAVDDVYLTDLVGGATGVISHTAAVAPGATITGLAISPDGRWVAWTLRRVSANTGEEIATLRLHDTATTQTRTVLELERSGLFSVALSEDARELAFTTRAALGREDADQIEDVYVWTRADEHFRLASRRADGSRFGRIQVGAAILTPDGRHLAFVTQYEAAIPGSQSAVQIVDLANGAHDEIGAPGDVALRVPLGSIDLSADGRMLTLATPESLLPIDVNDGATDVYVFDRQTRRFELASVDSQGAIGNCASEAPRISHDGARVVFRSCADNFHPGADGSVEIYVRDRAQGRTILQTRPIDGQLPSGHQPPTGAMPRFFAEPSISGDGSHVVFASASERLVSDDGSRRSDVFVVSGDAWDIRRVGLRATAPLRAGASRGPHAREGAVKAFASRDAAHVAFNVQADNLLHARAHGALRIDRSSGVIADAMDDELVSLPSRSIEVVEGISDDGGRALVRRTLGPRDPWDDLPGFDPEVPYDLWLADPTGRRTRVDGHPDLGTRSRTVSAVLSGSGDRVAFAAWPAPFGMLGVYVFDRLGAPLRRVDVLPDGGTPARGALGAIALSRNGRWLVFASPADGLVTGDLDGSADLFLVDLDAGGLVRLVQPANGSPLLGLPEDEVLGGVAVSDDGMRVLFDSTRLDLAPNGSGGRRMFLLDRDIDALHRLDAPVGDRAMASSPSLSADGRMAAFLQSGLLRVFELHPDGAVLPLPVASPQPLVARHVALSPDGRVAALSSAAEFPWLPDWVSAEVSVPYLLQLPESPMFGDGFEAVTSD